MRELLLGFEYFASKIVLNIFFGRRNFDILIKWGLRLRLSIGDLDLVFYGLDDNDVFIY